METHRKKFIAILAIVFAIVGILLAYALHVPRISADARKAVEISKQYPVVQSYHACMHATTMIYVQLVVFNEEESYTCKSASNAKEASDLIEHGFQYVTDIDGTKLFRKRK